MDPSLANRKIGFPCHHLYESTNVVPVKGELNGDGETSKRYRVKTPVEPIDLRSRLRQLRGADALLCLTAIQAGFKVDCMTLASLVDPYNLEYTVMTDHLGLPKINPSSKQQIALNNFKDIRTKPEFKQIVWLKDLDDEHEVPRGKVENIEVSVAGYFGNEANDGYIYAQCAITVSMPAWDSEARLKILEALFIV